MRLRLCPKLRVFDGGSQLMQFIFEIKKIFKMMDLILSQVKLVPTEGHN